MINSHDVAERIIPIKLAWATVYHGADLNDPEIQQVLALIAQAEAAELAALPREKRESASRYAMRNAEAILQPFIAQGMACAKFGLITFHAVQELVSDGLYDADANPAFDAALQAIISEKGSVVEMHNIDGVDRSAQKHARKVVEHMQRLGYFLRWEAA